MEEFKGFQKSKDFQEKYNLSLDIIKEVNKQRWCGHQFHHYTKHNIEHSNNILDKLNHLLKDQYIEFTAVEEFILLASIYLHDIGMVCTDKDILEKYIYSIKTENFPYEQGVLEKIREHHHLISSDEIKKNNFLGEHFAINSMKDELNLCIANLCKAHADEEEKFPLYCEENIAIVPGQNIRLKLLAVLLRIGDALDCDASKCMDKEDYKKVKDSISYIHRAHFWKHYFVLNNDIKKGEINLTFRIPSDFESSIKNGIIKMVNDPIEKHLKFFTSFNVGATIKENKNLPLFNNANNTKFMKEMLNDKEVYDHFKNLIDKETATSSASKKAILVEKKAEEASSDALDKDKIRDPNVVLYDAKNWFNSLIRDLKGAKDVRVYLRSFKHPDDFNEKHKDSLMTIMNIFVQKIISYGSDTFNIIACNENYKFSTNYRDPIEWIKIKIEEKKGCTSEESMNLINKCIKIIGGQPAGNLLPTIYMIDENIMFYNKIYDQRVDKDSYEYYRVDLNRTLIPFFFNKGFKAYMEEI